MDNKVADEVQKVHDCLIVVKDLAVAKRKEDLEWLDKLCFAFYDYYYPTCTSSIRMEIEEENRRKAEKGGDEVHK